MEFWPNPTVTVILLLYCAFHVNVKTFKELRLVDFAVFLQHVTSRTESRQKPLFLFLCRQMRLKATSCYLTSFASSLFTSLFFCLCGGRFSTDEGECWHTYNFTDDPLHFSGMDSEPGSRSMNVSLWGYRNYLSKWVVITIDFRKLFSRECRSILQCA